MSAATDERPPVPEGPLRYLPHALLLGAMALFPYCLYRVFLLTPI